MIKYDPVVEKGLFRVDYKEFKKLYSAIDEAEAKYCLIDEFRLFPQINNINEILQHKEQMEAILKSIQVTCIKKTVRVSDTRKRKAK